MLSMSKPQLIIRRPEILPHEQPQEAEELWMPYTLAIHVSGFDGLFDDQIKHLERKLTEFFFHAPQLQNGILSIYLDMFGNMASLHRRMQLFFFMLRSEISPALNFDIQFHYGQNS